MTQYDLQALSCKTILLLDGTDGALPLSTINQLNRKHYCIGAYEKMRRRAVLQRNLPVNAVVPCFTLKYTCTNEIARRYSDVVTGL